MSLLAVALSNILPLLRTSPHNPRIEGEDKGEGNVETGDKQAPSNATSVAEFDMIHVSHEHISLHGNEVLRTTYI